MNPLDLGRRAARDTLAQDARPRRLVALPGGGGVAGQVRPGSRSHGPKPVSHVSLHPVFQPPPTPDRDATRTLTVTMWEAELIRTALTASQSPSMHELAHDLAVQWAGIDSDPCPAHGIPRPS